MSRILHVQKRSKMGAPQVKEKNEPAKVSLPSAFVVMRTLTALCFARGFLKAGFLTQLDRISINKTIGFGHTGRDGQSLPAFQRFKIGIVGSGPS